MKARLFLLLAVLSRSFVGYDNGLARTPVMGWSTWNYYHRNWTAEVFYDTVDAMIKTGLQAAGYEYINVDGGWWYSVNDTIIRNSTGYLTYDPAKYPYGILNVTNYIHENGFKYGHYTDAGKCSCNNNCPMSEGYEIQDINTFVSWGFDYIKYDSCSVQESNKTIVFRWRDLINATNRKVVLGNCRNGCMNDKSTANSASNPWAPWCIEGANMWRVSVDIKSTWDSMIHNLECTNGLGEYGQPGAWNDPDSLEIGNGEFIDDGSPESIRKNEAHFSLWCIVSAPLILGTDMTNLTTNLINIFSNKDAISINQNYYLNAGDILTQFNISNKFKNKLLIEKQNNNTSIYYKPLPTNIGYNASFVMLNSGNTSQFLELQFNELPISNNNSIPLYCNVFDIWSKEEYTYQSNYSANLPPQSVKFMRLDHCSF